MADPVSCTAKEPFIKLDPAGQASILNYSLPAETCFNANGYLDLKIDAACFKAAAIAVPVDNFWDAIADVPESQIHQLLNDDIVNGAVTPLTINSSFMHFLPLVQSAIYASKSQSGTASKMVMTAPGQKMTVGDSTETMISGLTTNLIVNQILKGRRPIIKRNFYGHPIHAFLPRPKATKPTITLVFHYKICTFLGNYGAGKTVKTFSLLPGEKTMISVRTFNHSEENKSKSENVFDSFSQHSAESLETILQNETSTDNSQSSGSGHSSEIGGGLQVAIPEVGSLGIGGGVSNQTTSSNIMSQHIAQLNSAIDTHTSDSNSVREVSVNTEVSTSKISETEESIVRQVANINLSRTLNFVYRQLLQEYVSITYLNDVSIVYSNGYPETKRVVKLHNIDELLNDVLQPGAAGSPCSDIINKVRTAIFMQLCNVFDYTDTKQQFMECITETLEDCCDDAPDIVNTYARKKFGLSQTAEGHEVPGIIMDVTKRILRTDSIVCDALLGQGEALDCYNAKLQDAATIKAALDNDAFYQQMQIINGIAAPTDKADKYKKVFGSCCDVAQNTNNCGCCGDCNC